jgi:hypothetical protein
MKNKIVAIIIIMLTFVNFSIAQQRTLIKNTEGGIIQLVGQDSLLKQLILDEKGKLKKDKQGFLGLDNTQARQVLNDIKSNHISEQKRISREQKFMKLKSIKELDDFFAQDSDNVKAYFGSSKERYLKAMSDLKDKSRFAYIDIEGGLNIIIPPII